METLTRTPKETNALGKGNRIHIFTLGTILRSEDVAKILREIQTVEEETVRQKTGETQSSKQDQENQS